MALRHLPPPPPRPPPSPQPTLPTRPPSSASAKSLLAPVLSTSIQSALFHCLPAEGGGEGPGAGVGGDWAEEGGAGRKWSGLLGGGGRRRLASGVDASASRVSLDSAQGVLLLRAHTELALVEGRCVDRSGVWAGVSGGHWCCRHWCRVQGGLACARQREQGAGVCVSV